MNTNCEFSRCFIFSLGSIQNCPKEGRKGVRVCVCVCVQRAQADINVYITSSIKSLTNN